MEQPEKLYSEAKPKPFQNRYIDISAPIHDSMTGWPGLPHVNVQKFQDLHKGDDVNITTFSMPVHSGTHVDAPRHLYKNGNDVTSIDFESVIGPCRVIEIPASAKSILPEHLENANVQPGERILFKTSNSKIDWTSKSFQRDFTFLSTPAAEILAALKVKAVGLDYICIGNRGNHKLVHSILFETGVCVIEGLNLADADAGSYELYCLPLKILGADAAPSRAILKTLN